MGMRSRLCSGCRRLISLIQHHFPAFGPLLIGAFIIAKLEDWGWIDAIYFCVVTSTVSLRDVCVSYHKYTSQSFYFTFLDYWIW
jgi:hypothetical protein